VHVRVEGVINPVKVRLVDRALAEARAQNAALLLVTIDTPGGLVVSMQSIVSALSNAPMPVVTFVEPRSAQATSAGAFILLAGDIAAMAPGTRVGAAHPVGGGKALDDVMDKKATSTLAALVKSLAERRGRPAALAEAMVRDSTSYTAEEAQEKKLIELLANDRAELFGKLAGRELSSGRKLDTAGLTRLDILPSWSDRLLDQLADPTLTSMLLSLGMLAILYELGAPGVGAGGAIGGVLLILGLLGSSVLALETSAIALFALGVVAIALEVKLPTHGVLGGAGVIALVFGALLLVDPSDYFGGVQRASLVLLGPVVGFTAIAMLLLARVTRRALAAPPATGSEALVGKQGTARSNFTSSSSGLVFVDGARWQAQADGAEINEGDRIEVVAVTGKPTRLLVRRVP
jgi:membrane-bound serine protease (ClpP class)